MKCAIYTRVSTFDQGTSIINQQEYFKDYIVKQNLEIYEIYSDEAFSGLESSKRQSFKKLIEDAKRNKYHILLSKSYSRFGRNQRETLAALSVLFEHNIRVIFIEDGLDSKRDKGQFGLFAWLAEQESRKISERIKLTWQHYNKEGKVHSTASPFGYDYDKSIKNFTINKKEKEIVILIYNLYLNGNSVNKIANILNDKNYSTKKNAKWHGKTIMLILRNEFYIGNLIQGKSHTIDITIKKTQKINRENWFIHKNNHPPIITDDVFNKVQDLYHERTKKLKP